MSWVENLWPFFTRQNDRRKYDLPRIFLSKYIFRVLRACRSATADASAGAADAAAKPK